MRCFRPTEEKYTNNNAEYHNATTPFPQSMLRMKEVIVTDGADAKKNQ
jgi:hypothetical protein